MPESDDTPGFFSEARIAILGLGLMGGSLAMALHGKCATLLGIDPHPEVVEQALRLGIVDAASDQPADLLPGADAVILAAPVNTILQLIQNLPRFHPGPAIVMDLGSTKVKIVEAMQNLPERFDPIGGHPMCGKEKSGLENAAPRLYQGATFAFSALPRSTQSARAFAEALACTVGAHPLWIEPAVHDRYVAATSHLPYLAANALAYSTPLETAPLAGPGYRSTTRLALTPSAMMLDVLMTNQENILAASRRLRMHLENLENRLANSDFSGLADLLNQGVEAQTKMINLIEHGGTL